MSSDSCTPPSGIGGRELQYMHFRGRVEISHGAKTRCSQSRRLKRVLVSSPSTCRSPNYIQVDQVLLGVEPLRYQVFEVDGDDEGEGADMYSSTMASNTTPSSIDTAGTSSSESTGSRSHLLSRLETGAAYYIRLSAKSGLVGWGGAAGAASNPVAPRGVPGQLPSVRISRSDAVTLQVELDQTAESNGAEVDGYVVEWDTNPSFSSGNRGHLSLMPDYRLQAVRVNTWQRGWTAASAFSLSLFDFGGSFSSRLGGLDGNGLFTFVSIVEGTNTLNRVAPNVTAGFGSAPLYKSVPRGGYLSVGGQSFRVCLDGGLPYEQDVLTLCSVTDPYAPAYFAGAATKYDNTLTRVSSYVLDTAVGSAMKLAAGDTALRTFSGPDSNVSVNDLTSTFARGDHVRLGHPRKGRVFSVCASLDFNSTSLPLCSADDAEEQVSVLERDIISATHEIQTFGLWANTSLVTSNVTSVLGFRLMFGDETSARSSSGGAGGCLSLSSSASQVRIRSGSRRRCLHEWKAVALAYLAAVTDAFIDSCVHEGFQDTRTCTRVA